MPAIITPFPFSESTNQKEVTTQSKLVPPIVSAEPADQASCDAAERLNGRVRGQRWPWQRSRKLLGDDRGAVTAEYAIVILAAVAFAGLLVAIMRSDEVRAMLVGLVQNALGAAG